MTFINKTTLNHILKYLAFTFIASGTLNLFSYSNAQAISFWHLNIGNYLNSAEATRELQRLNSLGFDGKLVEVIENDTKFQQVRIGCYFNKATASQYLNLISQNLMYPSLSKVGQDVQASTSICLGYDAGIKLPNTWQILDDTKALVLEITLLDYNRIIGFNGREWQSFISQEEISQDWLDAIPDSSELICQEQTTDKVDCEFEGEPIITSLSGEIVWQKANTVIYKNGTELNILRVVRF